MEIGAGQPYRWMLENIFPQLRSAVAMSLYLKSDFQSSAAPENGIADTYGENGSAAEPEACDGKSDEGDDGSVTKSDITVTDPASANSETGSAAAEVRTVGEQNNPIHRFALKTNLLYYAALMPNLELQWRINKLYTLSIEGNIAWWDKASGHKYYQLAMISPEVRRWIRPRGEWHGMYVGAFGGGSWYDLENGYKGYRGEAGMAGLSFGYMWPVGRALSLEAGLGAGYMYARYKEYIPYDGHYLYQRTKDMNYFGPLKVKFVFSWRFNDINKPKKNK